MGGYTAHKRPDTVGEPPSSEIGVLNIPSLKAKKLRKLPREKSTLRTLKEVRQQYPGVFWWRCEGVLTLDRLPETVSC
jgi:hypothetical protein